MPGSDALSPSIALIIDDLGNQSAAGQRAIELPGPVACAFLPYGHFTRQLAQQAYTRGKEVMLHLPMQSVHHNESDRGELVLDMTQQQFTRTLTAGLAAVPHVSGINNHRGSLITRHPGHMTWLMQAMRQRGGLFFVDSRTTAATVARRIAAEYRVPSIERNVFLDHDRQPDAVQAQFRRLVRIAQRDGVALGIGHPYPETLEVLSRELALLGDYNVQMVSVNRLIEIETGSKQPWQMSLSR
ncbi:MAG: divergent polysaccharide deacetylase family protein [Thiohalobacterales bacterium]